MSKNNLEQKSSKTAMFAALHRAISNKDFQNSQIGPDDKAEYFLPSLLRFLIDFKAIRTIFKRKIGKVIPGLHEYMIARTVYFDQVFINYIKKKTPQIVIMGAGYDTRAIRFAHLTQYSRIFELDIAMTQNNKIKILSDKHIEIPDNVKFVSINFNRDSLLKTLEDAGYEKDKITLFLWEGISYYLDPDSVNETLEFISHNSHNESAIAFDYMISINEDNVNNYGVKEFFEMMRKKHPGESLNFSISDGEIAQFLKLFNLKVKNHYDNIEIEKIFLINDSYSNPGSVTGHFRFALATPIKKEKVI